MSAEKITPDLAKKLVIRAFFLYSAENYDWHERVLKIREFLPARVSEAASQIGFRRILEDPKREKLWNDFYALFAHLTDQEAPKYVRPFRTTHFAGPAQGRIFDDSL